MRYPLLLPSVLIFGWIIHHNVKRNSGQQQKSIDAFLAKESEANAVRRKDISDLPYIHVPLDTLPLDITLNDPKKQLQIEQYSREIHNLAQTKLLNLTGISNTELKATYGPANLEALSICDQNYTSYIRNLHLLASCIYEEFPEQAVAVWEYCISIGTDISGTYEALGRYYLSHNDTAHFQTLFDHIPDKNSLSGKSILAKLEKLSS